MPLFIGVINTKILAWLFVEFVEELNKPVIKIGYTYKFIVMIMDNLGLGNNHSLLENGWGVRLINRVHFPAKFEEK